MDTILAQAAFGGQIIHAKHHSASTNSEMKFNVFLPDPNADPGSTPVLFVLAGLTCSEMTGPQEFGILGHAKEAGIALVFPDVSPRDTGTPGEDGDPYLGTGAAFYCDATEEPWSKHYKMYSYIAEELPAFIGKNFKTLNVKRCGIMGHSMGGGGALMIGLRNPGTFKSVSALAPLGYPTQWAVSQKAFQQYLGDDKSTWEKYDPKLLVDAESSFSGKVEDFKPWDEILIHQGTADPFFNGGALMNDKFRDAGKAAGLNVNWVHVEGYTHSEAFFVASFAKEHIDFHSKRT